MSIMRQTSLCAYYLLTMLITGVLPYRNPTVVNQMMKYEAEILDCFMNHERFGINIEYHRHDKDLGRVKAKVKSSSLITPFNAFKEDFPELSRIFYLISLAFLNIDSVKNIQTDDQPDKVDQLVTDLYELTVRAYLVGSLDEGVRYHNICHGMFVALVTNEFLFEYREVEQDKLNDLKHATMVFAGLFHDAGHPGIGNTILSTSDIQREMYINDVKLRIDELFVQGGLINNHTASPHIGIIGGLFEKQEGFVLEDVHKHIALMVYHSLFSKYIDKSEYDSFKRTIAECIDFTLMTRHYKDIYEPINYIVHVADLVLNGSNNALLLFEGSKAVYAEFMDEAKLLKVYSADPNAIAKFCSNPSSVDPPLRSSPQKMLALVCTANLSTIFADQLGFRAFVVDPVIKAFNIYDTDILKYLTIGLDNSSAFFISIFNNNPVNAGAKKPNPLVTSDTDRRYKMLIHKYGDTLKYAHYTDDELIELRRVEGPEQKLESSDKAEGMIVEMDLI